MVHLRVILSYAVISSRGIFLLPSSGDSLGQPPFLSSLITIITVIVSQVGGDTLYLRRNGAGDVVACWLDVEAMLANVVPAGNFFI